MTSMVKRISNWFKCRCFNTYTKTTTRWDKELQVLINNVYYPVGNIGILKGMKIYSTPSNNNHLINTTRIASKSINTNGWSKYPINVRVYGYLEDGLFIIESL